MSEFMLQQTQVARVLPIWVEWMERWPTPVALATSTRADVLRAWGNLGFPRRAVRLHETAKRITKDYGGNVPNDYEVLLTFPGIGEYTAGAITAFGFNKKSLVLDTNVRRLLSRAVDGIESPPPHITNLEKEKSTALIPLQAAQWAAATMELGALICTSKNPTCEKCPIKEMCSWRLKEFPKSTLLKKRSNWEGSHRQCRGIIMKSLRSSTSMTKKDLRSKWSNFSQFEAALQSLINDGLITKKGSKYQLID